MSAIVDIVLAEHKDVLTVPVVAIVEGTSGTYCWVQHGDEIKKRAIRVGDTNDQFSVIHDGLQEGDSVLLNPLAFVEEAQEIANESKKDDANEKEKTPKSSSKGSSATNGGTGT
jgi:multidrug efflux pump subunit AcrA (membrane-fusion protein)